MRSRTSLVRALKAQAIVRRRGDDPVKLTALLYLQEALREERYEDCAPMIAVAREFGASEAEIRNLLEDSRRTPEA